MAPKKIKRSLFWMQRVLQVLGQRTTLPDKVEETIIPTLDAFGWERWTPQGGPPEREIATGAAATASVNLVPVPEGTMRYYMFVSGSHNDPVAGGLDLALICRFGGIDLAIAPAVQGASPLLIRHGFAGVPFLLAPGQQLVMRSVPAPAVGLVLTMRAQFVDVPFGEYIRAK